MEQGKGENAVKKKVIVLIIASMMIASLSACGNDSGKSANVENQEQSNEEEQTDEQVNEEEPAAVPTETTLADLEAYLLDKGVLTGEKTETAASMIGAVSGFKYADSHAEFYEYDENSDAYKTLSSGGSVEIEGMSGYAVSATSINGKYVLIASGDISQEVLLILLNK